MLLSPVDKSFQELEFRCLQEKEQESGGGDMQRKLNWFDLICIGIGVILGSGIFSSTPYVAANLAGCCFDLLHFPLTL